MNADKIYMFTLFLMLFLIVFSAGTVSGQDGVSLGLGGASTAVARGTEAVYWNPANLGFRDTNDNPLEVKIYSLIGGVGNNSLNIDLYNRYNGKTLTDGDKSEIMRAIPDDGLRVWGKADVSVLAFAYRNFGFSIEGNGIGEGSVARDAFKFILYGNSTGDSVYTFDSSGNGFGIVNFNFSYGYVIAKNLFLHLPFKKFVKITQVNAGATFSIIRGIGFVNLIDSRGRLVITNNGLNAPASFRSRESQGGWGASLDLGVSVMTESQWCAGFTVDNSISSIRWSKKAKERIERFDLRKLMFLDELSDLNLDDYRVSEDRDIGSFSEQLPRNFRLGVAKHFRYGLLNGECGRENDKMRFTAGGGIFIRFLKLYGGIGMRDSDVYLSGAVGFDLPHVWIDFGFRNRSGFTSSTSKGITVANSIRLRF